MTGRAVHKADYDVNLDRARAAACATRARSPVEAIKAILVPGLGPPPRPDGAKATKRSHLSARGACMGRGSRGRLRPERRLVLGFSWSLDCGGFAWALTKAAHAPEGILAVLQGGRPPQTKSQPPESSPTAPDTLRPLTTQSRARETRKREDTAAETPKTRRLRRASAHRPTRDAAAAPPHRCGAGRTQRTQAHKKQRGQSRRRDE